MVDAVTVEVFTVKSAVMLPAGTVTLAGTVATEVVPLVSITSAPPAGAGPLKVTVPVAELVSATVAGLRVTDDAVTWFTTNVANLLTPLSEAVIVAVRFWTWFRVFTVKLAVVLPAPTVTLDGTVATVLSLLNSVTVLPAAGAAADSVTVPVDGFPPVTEVGFRLTADTVGRFTVSVADLLLLL